MKRPNRQRTSPKRLRHPAERGATAVELAIIAPFLVALLIGGFEIGVMMNRQQGLEQAAREGARYGAISPDTTRDDIVVHVQNSIEDSEEITITVEPDVEQPCDGRAGDEVEVAITTDVTFDILFVASVDKQLFAKGVFVCYDE